MEIDLGLVRSGKGKFRIPWLRGAKKRRKSRRGGKMAQRMRNAPKACKVQLGNCMRGSGGRAKAGRCMRAFHACIK
jgi:hypothetical protein